MTIKNNSTSVIRVAGEFVQPTEDIQIQEHIFDTIDVYSDSGSVKITCEYTDVYLEYKRDLEASVQFGDETVVTIFTKQSIAEKVRDILSGWDN